MDFNHGEIEAADEVDSFEEAVALDGGIGTEEARAGGGGEEGEEMASGHMVPVI